MNVNIETRKTPIYNRHVELGAKIVDFHGWLLPIQYKSIVAEHLAVRKNAGIFDVSHMGEIEIKGKDAYSFIQYLTTNNLDKISPGGAIYSPICREDGGIIDDLVVYMFSKEHILLVVNASNIEKDFNWIAGHKGRYNADIKNISDSIALISLQGPNACGTLEKFLNKSLSDLKHFHFREFIISGEKILVSRTGYTGEDGFELFIDTNKGEWLWDELMKFKPEPIGLGARDTLRLEKGYILYGNDADESTTPIEAGISFSVDFRKDNFIGKDALKKNKPKKKLVRLEMLDAGIPRQGFSIMYNGSKIGTVTSGTFSPSLNKGIAMGYIEWKEVEPPSTADIDIRGNLYKAIVRRKNEHPK